MTTSTITGFTSYTNRVDALQLIRAYRALDGAKWFASPTRTLGVWFVALVVPGHHDGGKTIHATTQWKRDNPRHYAMLATPPRSR